MKTEIRKVLEELDYEARSNAFKTSELVNTATSSLTSLIIKWLEGKEYDYYSESCGNCKHREGCKIDNIYKCSYYEREEENE